MPTENQPSEIKWKTYSHLQHPYDDLSWHLFWGILIGIAIYISISQHDFWFLIISLISLVFFFHPFFYKPRLMDIKLTEKGITINKNFYPWDKFYAFEIFDNQIRRFIFFFPKRFSFGLHIPLEEFFISEKEVKSFLKRFLKEYKGQIPIIEKIYRSFYT